ncbi:hypothetical protein ACRFNL_22855 [Serratia marcescens]|uniref:hypothetical protein n=1 Tax=Serratia TaxID=613 RepID=UPI003D36EA5C
MTRDDEVNMLTHKQVREEVSELVRSVSTSDTTPPSFFDAAKPALYLFAISEFLIVISVAVEFSNFGTVQGESVFSLFLNLFFWAILSVMSVSYTSLLAMIPSEVSRNSELLKMLRKKVRAYIKVLVVLWVLVSAAICVLAGGGAIVIFGTVFVSIFLSVLLFNMDVSRYQLSGLFGALQEAKKAMMLSR